ncbi:hypothetical protein A6A04_13315 [Paramagnetospirillum marisnigri]|uniref:HTH cro/C1-type domain-containing protein n=1 Tax=Paramagnetospirillum marisnigri TaxID=1285242 RepID=A0A178MWU8_9PROT|nr:hypothetical protein A6A04_13315 [Paramagnetospirillum marisnigri]
MKLALQDAAKKGVTQKQIAEALGVNPSVITRRLNGSANLTLATIGDLAWALDKYPRLRLFSAAELESNPGSNSAEMYKTRVSGGYLGASKSELLVESGKKTKITVIEA